MDSKNQQGRYQVAPKLATLGCGSLLRGYPYNLSFHKWTLPIIHPHGLALFSLLAHSPLGTPFCSSLKEVGSLTFHPEVTPKGNLFHAFPCKLLNTRALF